MDKSVGGLVFFRRVAEVWIGVWRYEGMEVEDRGIWFEDREVGKGIDGW